MSIDKGDRVAAAHIDLAHVRDIEKSSVRACAQVLFNGAGGILDRHVPAAKVDHAPAQLPMRGIEWRSFEFWGDCGHVVFSGASVSWDPDKNFNTNKR